MKKMNVLSLVSLFLMLLSCSEQEQKTEEKLETTRAKTELNQDEEHYLYGPQIYHLIAVAEIAKLNVRKIKLVEEIERGNKKATEELERVQKSIGEYKRLSERMLIRPGKFPRPPKGCISPEDKGCRVKLNSLRGILLADVVKLHKIEIRDSENNIVGESTVLEENSQGEMTLFFKAEFEGEATMYFTIETKATGKMILPLTVSKN